MLQVYPITDEVWRLLIADAASHFDDLTLMRGYQFHKQRRVQEIDMPDPHTMHAAVYDAKPHEQTILLDELGASECDCSERGLCKHIAAVLLEYASHENRPVQMLVSARAMAHRLGADASPPKRSSPVSDQQEAGQVRLAELSERFPALRVQEWEELFALSTASLDWKPRSYSYAKDAIALIGSYKPPLPLAVDLLFQLNALCYVMERLIQPAQGSPHYQGGYYNDYFINQSLSELNGAISALFKEPLALLAGSDPDGHAADTLARLRKGMLKQSALNSYYMTAYLQFWRSWTAADIDHAAVCTEELRAIAACARELGADRVDMHMRLARCWMHLHMGDDRSARDELADGGERSSLPPAHILNIAAWMCELESWPRLLYWLVESRSLFMDRRREGMRQYFDYWEMLVEQLPEAEAPMWETLGSMLPYSRSVYNDLLIRHRRWKQWMDLQLAIGRDPLELRATSLQPIEKEAPELLLPFYHQAVERYVLAKNRAGYKSAVKLLKRLAKLYKKLKQERRWSDFIESFTARHSRLRALQEELRKGKLIS